MSTPGSRATTVGLTIMLLSVSAAMHLEAGGLALLLCFLGFFVGANLIAVGVRMADGPVPNPIVPVVFDGPRALTASMCRNISAMGLVMASGAFTAVSGEEADPVLCFGMFLLLLLGLTFVDIGARGE